MLLKILSRRLRRLLICFLLVCVSVLKMTLLSFSSFLMMIKIERRLLNLVWLMTRNQITNPLSQFALSWLIQKVLPTANKPPENKLVSQSEQLPT